VSEALVEPGQHVVIYGERGVGKTSLATVCADVIATASGIYAIKINCQSSDNFDSIWRKVFNEISIVSTVPGFGFTGKGSEVASNASKYLANVDVITPDHVRVGMKMLTQGSPLAFFLDEFDRISDSEAHGYFADTLKTLSDEVIPVTVALVGVADNVDELVREHASVERAIVQVHMPRMSRSELADIVVNGLKSVSMTAETAAVEQITMLSQGLPHYTHLLAQQAAGLAVFHPANTVPSDQVTAADVEAAIGIAIDRTQESIRDLYYRATYSARDNMYKQVLLACACAPADEKGFFQASAIRKPLSTIMGRPYDIPQFALHLNAFSGERGPVLKKEGTRKKFRYRFINPLMQPYITMRGLKDGMITPKTLKKLQE
jgi:Cdc6-like AAA superfamily ATPase